MNYILIAIVSGMLLTSSHETEEACLGRKAIIEKEHKISNSKCIDMRQGGYVTTINPSNCIRLDSTSCR